MNVEFEDEEFTAMDAESRVSEHKKQSNDPPPEFLVSSRAISRDFKSYCKKVKLCLVFTRTPAHLQGPRVLSRLRGPARDVCDRLEPEDMPE